MTLIARILGPENFGLYFIVFTCASVLGIVLDSCVGQAILTRSPGYEVLWPLWQRSSVLLASIGIVMAAVVAIFSVSRSDVLMASLLLLVSIPVTVASMVPRSLALIAGRVRDVATVDSTAAVVANGVTLLAVATTQNLAAAALSAVLLAVIRYVMLTYVQSRLAVVPVARPAKREWTLSKSYWREMAGTYQSQLVNFLSRTADSLIVSAVLGPASLAQYSRAFSFVIGPAQQAQMALTPTATRDLALSGKSQPDVLLGRKLASRLYALLLPSVVMASLSGPVVVEFLLGPEWATAGELMILSVGLAVFMVLSMPARWILLARRDNRALRIDSYCQLLTLGAVLIGSVVAGLHGALIASSFIAAPIVNIVIWALVGVPFRRMYFAQLVPLSALIIVVAAACAFTISIRGLPLAQSATLLLVAAAVLTFAFWRLNEYLMRRSGSTD